MLSHLSSKKILLLFVLSLYCLLIGYKLLRLGLHGDGVQYACVARNLADGMGTFWKPYHDDHRHPVFHEHPPLVFWIQSLFFRIFGDGAYFEAFYGFFIGLIILGSMAMLWQGIRRNFQLPPVGSWWPMMLLVPLPIFTYMLQTNRLVITWTILAIIATYISCCSVLAHKHHVFYSLFSGGLIYLGFLAKGPVAFFTFAVPILAWLTLKAKFTKAITSVLLAFGVFAILFLATSYLYADSIEFWRGFWQHQIIASLKSARAPGDTRWYIAERWMAEMIVPILVAGALMLTARVSFRRIHFSRLSLFFLFVALAASLPFMISLRQKTRYILHSFPFYVLTLAFVTENIANQIESILTKNRKIRLATGLGAILFFTVAVISMLYFKDHDAKRRPFYHDFYLQNIELPERITLSVCPENVIFDDWLFADMQRYYKVSLAPNMGHRYLIVVKGSNCEVPEGYKLVNHQSTLRYLLFKKDGL